MKRAVGPLSGFGPLESPSVSRKIWTNNLAQHFFWVEISFQMAS
jgi:hypothetical protein